MLTYTACSENEVQGRILEHTIEEITAKWKKLHNEDFTIHTPHKTSLGHQLKEYEMGRLWHM
jgi:hypothetical protein